MVLTIINYDYFSSDIYMSLRGDKFLCLFPGKKNFSFFR
ncbi:hypothetical protein ASZ90_006113 [hydrocarbon metagenome]|uniref:Uncharacterized protein n=1 Tax=hydrocarbon metagenome TaxID=938273 RepID=A0A0W8FTD4_9ZZZZ